MKSGTATTRGGLATRHESAVQVVQRLIRHVEVRGTDYAPEILRMDVGRYFDEDIAAAERERIFATMPLAAAHSSELTVPGDFVTKEFAASTTTGPPRRPWR